MKTTVIAAIVTLMALASAQPLRAETWCLRGAGEGTARHCDFPSAQTCAQFALHDPFGGICERDNRPAREVSSDTDGRKTATRRKTHPAD